MFNVGGAEFFVILLVALLVIGPTKLPQAARQVGQFMGEFRRIANGFQNELKSAMDDTPIAMAPKVSPTEKPKSTGGPTEQPAVIEAASTEQPDEEPDGTDEPNITGDSSPVEGSPADHPTEP